MMIDINAPSQDQKRQRATEYFSKYLDDVAEINKQLNLLVNEDAALEHALKLYTTYIRLWDLLPPTEQAESRAYLWQTYSEFLSYVQTQFPNWESFYYLCSLINVIKNTATITPSSIDTFENIEIAFKFCARFIEAQDYIIDNLDTIFSEQLHFMWRRIVDIIRDKDCSPEEPGLYAIGLVRKITGQISYAIQNDVPGAIRLLCLLTKYSKHIYLDAAELQTLVDQWLDSLYPHIKNGAYHNTLIEHACYFMHHTHINPEQHSPLFLEMWGRMTKSSYVFYLNGIHGEDINSSLSFGAWVYSKIKIPFQPTYTGLCFCFDIDRTLLVIDECVEPQDRNLRHLEPVGIKMNGSLFKYYSINRYRLASIFKSILALPNTQLMFLTSALYDKDHILSALEELYLLGHNALQHCVFINREHPIAKDFGFKGEIITNAQGHGLICAGYEVVLVDDLDDNLRDAKFHGHRVIKAQGYAKHEPISENYLFHIEAAIARQANRNTLIFRAMHQATTTVAHLPTPSPAQAKAYLS